MGIYWLGIWQLRRLDHFTERGGSASWYMIPYTVADKANPQTESLTPPINGWMKLGLNRERRNSLLRVTPHLCQHCEGKGTPPSPKRLAMAKSIEHATNAPPPIPSLITTFLPCEFCGGTGTGFEVSDKVEGLLSNNWYPGVIQEVNADGTYKVELTDGTYASNFLYEYL